MAFCWFPITPLIVVKKHQLPIYIAICRGFNSIAGKSASDFFGMVKMWPFHRLGDLQLGDKKGHELNHLVRLVFVDEINPY